MHVSERDTHFAGFAKLQFPEIEKLFFTMYARIEEQRPIEEIDAIEDEIRILMAQRAYDLVYFLMTSNPADAFDVGFGTPQEIQDTIEMLPDLTEWPTPTELPDGLYMTEKISIMKPDLPNAFDTLEKLMEREA